VKIERDIGAKQGFADNEHISRIVLDVNKCFIHIRVFAAIERNRDSQRQQRHNSPL
jgi:hypothetical protein